MEHVHHSSYCPSQTQYETLEGSSAEAYLFDPHDSQTLPLSCTLSVLTVVLVLPTDTIGQNANHSTLLNSQTRVNHDTRQRLGLSYSPALL